MFLFLQANVNPNAELTDDFKLRRKAVHIGSCELMREDLKKKTADKESKIKVILLLFHILSLLSWFDSGIVQIRMDEIRFGAFCNENHDHPGISVSQLRFK